VCVVVIEKHHKKTEKYSSVDTNLHGRKPSPYEFTWSFEPYVEFVPYSTRVLAQKAGRLGRVSDHYPTAPLIVGFRLLDARVPAPAPLTHCRLAVHAVVWSDLPSVASIGIISGGHEIETFAITAFGCNQRLDNQRSMRRIDAQSNVKQLLHVS
jgi:hypothetical protein